MNFSPEVDESDRNVLWFCHILCKALLEHYVTACMHPFIHGACPPRKALPFSSVPNSSPPSSCS